MRFGLRLWVSLLLVAAAVAPGLAPSAAAAGAAPTVSVLYAGSLAALNDQRLGPAFTRLTGIGYSGHGGGSLALAQEIAGGELTGDVFESVGTAALARVGSRRLPWAVAVASQPLVVAYNPHGRYAADFAAIARGRRPLRDLFSLLATPGLRLGRTDPAADPQGQAFVLMVRLATRLYRLPADTPTRILGGLENPAQLFEETALPAELQAGALDAASAFLPQALALHLPYVALPPSLDFAASGDARLYGEVSLRLPDGQVVRGAPLAVWAGPLEGPGSHTSLGVDYVRFLLSARGQALWRKAGYTPVAPQVYGHRALVPPGVAREIAALTRSRHG
ncbi:MAG: substrate-binding domain-containing protein [Firmicutes bacterium]|nr:substrate-binding domain-containing protein [Bacillota bacterium]